MLNLARLSVGPLPLTLGLLVGSLLGNLFLPSFSWSEESSAKKVSYHQEIRPILQKACQGCHQPAKAKGEYVLTSVDKLKAGGESGLEAIVPGDPDASYFMEQIIPDEDGNALMPQGAPALAAAEIELIRQWIEQGAVDDSPASTEPSIDAEHPPVYESQPVLTAVAFSPDGTMLAVSGYHEVLLHSGDGKQLLGRLVGLSERIESLAFSPDGKRLAVTGGSPGRFGEVQIWDLETKELLLSAPATYDTLYGVSWSNDGTRVAFGAADNTLRAINAQTGEQVLFQGAHDDWVLDTTWSKDDSHLISCGRDRSLKLTEVKTERFIDNITSITPGALKGGLLTIATRPGQDQVLIGGADGVPKLYKIYREQARKIGDDFNLIRAYPEIPGRIFSVAFNQDGSLFVAGSSFQRQGTAKVFDTESGKVVSELEGPQGGLFSVAFHPKEKIVLTAGFDGMIRLHDVETGKQIHAFIPVPLEK
ncbi:Planctomycete cytochrome C [Planctomycetales bacterium 10988]|nr:Planctomycete cytochrome C [Planctomycetales bacterium 10988]